jgi:hypothetical protein
MRQALGRAFFDGILGVTRFGIFLTPVFFYIPQWFGRDLPRRDEPSPIPALPPGGGTSPPPSARQTGIRAQRDRHGTLSHRCLNRGATPSEKAVGSITCSNFMNCGRKLSGIAVELVADWPTVLPCV